MRKKTRDETPNAKPRNGSRMSPVNVSNERVNLIENSPREARDKAIAALARLKEKEKTLKLHSVRVDGRTVLCSNKKENLDRMVREYTEVKPVKIK